MALKNCVSSFIMRLPRRKVDLNTEHYKSCFWPISRQFKNPYNLITMHGSRICHEIADIPRMLIVDFQVHFLLLGNAEQKSNGFGMTLSSENLKKVIIMFVYIL